MFESNGPDVKVRGNAQHVAEKYLQLARDAQSSGDSVMAENYYQHAEHYLRIVAAAQSFAQQNGPPGGIRRPFGEDVEDDEADGPEEEDLVPAGHGPQPDVVDLQAQRPLRETPNRDDQGEGEQPREFRRPRERDFRDRDRDNRDGRDSRDNRPPRDREFRENREAREFREAGAGEDVQGNGWSGHQPDFLRRASGGGSSSGNGRFRRDSRPRSERKSEAPGDAQPNENEPPNDNSEDFASN